MIKYMCPVWQYYGVFEKPSYNKDGRMLELIRIKAGYDYYQTYQCIMGNWARGILMDFYKKISSYNESQFEFIIKISPEVATRFRYYSEPVYLSSI